MSNDSGTLSAQTFTIGSSTRFGVGTIGELSSIISNLSHSRAFLVTDHGVAATGMVTKIRGDLESAGLETELFDAVHANPSTETLDRGAAAARAFGQAVVVAIGGGSVIDAAKGIALMAVNQGAARDFDYRNPQPHPGLPLVAVPTTAGTGAETNGFGVIDDPESGRKFYVGHQSVVPKAVILDPGLTRGMPSGATAATGMDTLTHALESLSSPRNNPYAEGINLQVVSMVARFLPQAVADGANLEARSQMLLAAHMAGLAFATTGLGLGHAVAHAVSARLGVAHGVALSVLLPHVLRFNLPVRTQTYARVAWALGVGDSHRDDAANANLAIERIRALSREVTMPSALRQVGCNPGDVRTIVDDALADEVVANAARLPDNQELESIVQAAL